MLRIVLDSNILVSALISKGGAPYLLYQGWSQKKFMLITSEYQLEELTGVFQYPKLRRFVSPDEAKTMLEGLQDYAFLVKEIPCISYSPDPDDNPILATAIAGRADMVVSGDKRDMLALAEVESIRIVTARDALALLGIERL